MHGETTFLELPGVIGIDFSGPRKSIYLTLLKLVFQKGLMELPERILGLQHQLENYVLPDHDIPQDLVATLMIFAGLLRYLGLETLEETPEEPPLPALARVFDRYARTAGDRYARITRR